MTDESTKPYFFPVDEIEQYISINYSSPGKISRIISPTLFPPLTIKTNNISRQIEVLMITSKTEDKQLLHSLLAAARSQ